MRSVLGFLFSAALLAACSTGQPAAPVFAVVVDASASTSTPALRAEAEAKLLQVFDAAAAAEGELIVSTLGRGNRENAVVLSGAAVPACANTLLCRAARQQAGERLVQAVRSAVGDLASRRQAGSDILLAIANAAADLAAHQGQQRMLVVLSDGLVQSPDLRLTEARLVSERGVATPAVPDLHGVDVYMAGLGRTASGTVSFEELRALTGFWRRYFERSGGRLCLLGAHLVRFPVRGRCS